MYRRIITCQGGIELITAVAALACKEQKRRAGWRHDENYLVLHSLCAPQFDEFDQVIRRIASTLLPWKAVVTIDADRMRSLHKQTARRGAEVAISQLHDLVGLAHVDSVFLVRNWQFGNQLLINAYRGAEKTCYGDGLGSFSGRLDADCQPIHRERFLSRRKRLSRRLKAMIRQIRCRLLTGHRFRELEQVEFDVGYFAPLAGYHNNGTPSMPTHIVDRRYLLDALRDAKSAVDPGLACQLRQQAESGRPLTLLLGENLCECGDTSLHKEIALYRDFLLDRGVPRDSMVLFKPHPRDDIRKKNLIRQAIKDAGYDVHVMDQPDVARMPFELLFLTAFLDDQLNSIGKLQVLTAGFPAISLMYLFAMDVKFGYGERLIRKYIHHHHVRRTMDHEAFVRAETARWRNVWEQAA